MTYLAAEGYSIAWPSDVGSGSGGTLGALGLGGAKRLSNDFAIVSKLGEGTKVTIVRWK